MLQSRPRARYRDFEDQTSHGSGIGSLRITTDKIAGILRMFGHMGGGSQRTAWRGEAENRFDGPPVIFRPCYASSIDALKRFVFHLLGEPMVGEGLCRVYWRGGCSRNCVHGRVPDLSCQPLDDGAVDDALAVPDDQTIRVAAGQIRHPLLPPIKLDPSQPLSPDEAAVLAVLSIRSCAPTTTTRFGLGAITSGGTAPKSATHRGHGLSLRTGVAGQLQRLQPGLELGCDRANCP